GKSQTLATPVVMVGAAVINLALCLVLTAIFFHGFGSDFFASANAVYGTKAWPFSAPPFYIFLTSIAGGSSALAWFLGISLVGTFFVVLWLQFIQPMRALFAYAFDGVLLLRVEYVCTRWLVLMLCVASMSCVLFG